MAKITKSEISLLELKEWRAGYQKFLEEKGLPSEMAHDISNKTEYKDDLYPSKNTTLSLFDSEPKTENTAIVTIVKKDPRPKKIKATPVEKIIKLPEIIEGKVNKKILTPSKQQLIVASSLIAAEQPDGNDMAFTHSILCQVGLPRSKVDGREFLRQSGAAWINVQAGMLDEGKGPVLQPIPYGAIPRLALAWVSTYAKRHNTREIPIGDTAAEFLRLMGMDKQGARYTTLRTQMHALAACRLQLGFNGRTFNGQAVEQFDAWIVDKKSTQRTLWPGVMRLSDSYYQEILEHGVPLDNRALHALKGSALALDIYTWLAHRLHRLSGRPTILHWKSLREQFAQEYQGKDADKDFKKKFIPALQAALAVYPQAKVKQVTGGLMLIASPPPVSHKNM